MTREEWKKGWKELWIRFNTSPKLYQKSDFGLLMLLLKYVGYNSGGSSEGAIVDVETLGKGNVVTDVKKLEQTLVVTKSNIEPGGDSYKEYFPDFAYWQRPGAKKGAQVLVTSAKIDFGYTKNYKKFLLEIGNCTLECLLQDDYSRYEGTMNIKSLLSRVRYLLEHDIIDTDYQMKLKFGMYNSIHDRSLYQDSDFTCTINNIQYDFETHVILKRPSFSDLRIKYTDLEVLIPVEDILEWENVVSVEILASGEITADVNEINHKLGANDIILEGDIVNLKIYTDIDSYQLSGIKNDSFSILLYYNKKDEWTIKEISQKTVCLKRHKTKVYLRISELFRDTYRKHICLNVVILNGPHKVVVGLENFDTTDWYTNPQAMYSGQILIKRFIGKSKLNPKKSYLSCLFITSVPNYVFSSDLHGVIFKTSSSISDGYYSGFFYTLIGYVPKDFVKKRRKKPTNGYHFKLKNGKLPIIKYHRSGKIRKYAYFCQIPVFRYYENTKLKFNDWLMPKTAY